MEGKAKHAQKSEGTGGSAVVEGLAEETSSPLMSVEEVGTSGETRRRRGDQKRCGWAKGNRQNLMIGKVADSAQKREK